jgi:hypothetical protein
MPDMIPVKIKPLSGEAFRPYGQVLERGALVYPDTDEGRVAMEMLQVRRRPDAHQIAQLAIHFSYRSYWIPGSYVTSSSMSAGSNALPRLRTLCTNSKKPK